MNLKQILSLFFLGCFLSTQPLLSLGSLFQPTEDFSFFFSGKYRPETFYARNANLLNDNNSEDKFYFSRHTLDITFDTLYGQGTYGRNVAEMKATLRNRAVWGDPASVSPVTPASIVDLDAKGLTHTHYLPRNILWIREFWLGFDIGEAFGLTFKNTQTFMIGAFPFLLGRGISLGEAYAVGPSTLGFYTDFNVDQFAWGAKFSGDIVKNILEYDSYVAILRNNTANIRKNIAAIYEMEIGRRDDPERGFGSVDFLVAQRFKWHVFKNECWGELYIEPYGMFNHDPEQRVEFKADAESKLLTLGLSSEYEGSRFAFGFDTAMNFGRQRIRGWDRNRIEKQLRDGVEMRVNSHAFIGLDPVNPNGVTNLDPYKVPHSPKNVVAPNGNTSNVGKAAQKLINDAPQCEFFNGKPIGFVENFSDDMPFIPNNVLPAQEDQFFNATNRFRDGYKNRYKGWMFVTDAALFLWDKDMQLAVTAGIASGDDNPNFETVDGDFTGFIGLQEIYTGKRVRSAFFLGSSGKLKIPLSAPTTGQAPSRFAQLTSGFSNLVFWGAAMHYTPSQINRRIVFNPNLYMFWQDKATHKFDVVTKKELNGLADTFLGTELNLFFDYYLFRDLKLYYVSSIFVPGGHFKDIKGKPFNSRQLRLLSARNIEDPNDPSIPNIGDDLAFTMNIGLEYRF
ncbi:MAG: hypothetical protein WD055_05220 [Candidatus Dependentiae bacterium]